MTEKAGINFFQEPIHVNHADLERMGDSIFKSVCPKCKDGVLLVNRDQRTLGIVKKDRCILCAQSFIYDDFKESTP